MDNLPNTSLNKGLQNTIVNMGNNLVQQSTYQAQITRKTPTAIILLLDQSGSMSEGSFSIEGQSMSKAKALAYQVNTLLAELVQKSIKDYGIGDYVDVCILGYGASGSACEPAWIGNLAGKTWVTMNELHQNATVETQTVVKVGRGGITQTEDIHYKQWIKPVCKGGTPLAAALTKVHQLSDEWIRTGNHKVCYPPTIINFTDGQATDVQDPNDLLPLCKKITDLHTQDGHVLLYNCHLSTISTNTCLFPTQKNELPNDKNAAVFFEGSSFIPQRFNSLISSTRHDADAYTQYKGMVFNAPINTVAAMLQLGTTQIK